MKLSSLSFLRVAVAMASLALVFAISLVGQEPSDPPRPQHPRWLTVHEYGFQVRLEAPQAGQAGWLLKVVDLGPDLPHLRQDLPPTAGQLQILGKGTVQLKVQANGDLQARVPRHWVRQGKAPHAQLKLRSQGALIFDCSIQSLFLS